MKAPINRNRSVSDINDLVRLICSACLLILCAYAYGTESAAVGNHKSSINYQETTTTFAAPAEYCILGTELNYDLSKWTFRFHLEIPASHHFANGDVFVYYFHPSTPDALWFSSGETPSASGYKPATWHALSERGPITYYSGKLNPIIPVTVVSKPLDVSSLDGGRVFIGYGLRETGSSTATDAFAEMQSHDRGTVFPVIAASQVTGIYVQYCFTVTGVTKTERCIPDECVIGLP